VQQNEPYRIDNIAQLVQTTSAKQLIAALHAGSTYDWWRGQEKLTKLESGEFLKTL